MGSLLDKRPRREQISSDTPQVLDRVEQHFTRLSDNELTVIVIAVLVVVVDGWLSLSVVLSLVVVLG